MENFVKADFEQMKVAIDKLESMVDEELNIIAHNEEDDIKMTKAIYRLFLINKLLDTRFVISDKLDGVMKKLLKAIDGLDKDEAFVVLVFFARTVLDTLSFIPYKNPQIISVNLNDIFAEIIRFFNIYHETPNLSTVETKCIICGNTMYVDKDKVDFANICKTCKGV